MLYDSYLKQRFNSYKVKRRFQSYEYNLKSIIKRKLVILIDQDLPLVTALFPNLDLTKFSKNQPDNHPDTDLAENSKNLKITSLANLSINLLNNVNSRTPNYNKLYNCKNNNQQERVRSVVRISRRSSEPQVMGSKPTGPV